MLRLRYVCLFLLLHTLDVSIEPHASLTIERHGRYVGKILALKKVKSIIRYPASIRLFEG